MATMPSFSQSSPPAFLTPPHFPGSQPSVLSSSSSFIRRAAFPLTKFHVATSSAPRKFNLPVRATTFVASPVAVPPPTELAPPPALYQKSTALGETKARYPPIKTFLLGIMAGTFISLGAVLSMAVAGSSPGLASTNPGLHKFLLGAVGLPTGLFLCVSTGAELYTGNTALLTMAFWEKKASLGQVATNWIVSYLGNLVGALAIVYLIFVSASMTPPAVAAALAIAKAKTSMTFLQAVVRGLLCNWLVCLAVYLATGSSSVTGKFTSVLLPVSMFVALGLEHSVANMLYVPLGILHGASVTWSQFFINNLIPVTIGNTIAGAINVATVYAIAFGRVGKAWFQK